MTEQQAYILWWYQQGGHIIALPAMRFQTTDIEYLKRYADKHATEPIQWREKVEGGWIALNGTGDRVVYAIDKGGVVILPDESKG